MKNIFITEKQVKKLKKAISAQDQVNNRANAGIMDNVAYRLNESPDSVLINFDSDGLSWRDDDCIAFCYSNKDEEMLFGERMSHEALIRNNGGVDDEDCYPIDMRGRYWENENIISFWVTPYPNTLAYVVGELKKNFPNLNIDAKSMIVDVWDRAAFELAIPYMWFFDGFLDDYGDNIRRVTIESKTPYIFRLEFKNNDVYFCGLDGILRNKEFVAESKKRERKNDEGELVPDKCDKCGGEIVVQIHGEPIFICKECGKYFGTLPFKK